MNKVEREYEQSIGVGLADWEITETEKALCNIADKLELVLHCTRMMQQGNMLAKDVFMKGVNHLEERYSKLEEFKPVKEIIAELDRYGLMREE